MRGREENNNVEKEDKMEDNSGIKKENKMS